MKKSMTMTALNIGFIADLLFSVLSIMTGSRA